MPGLSQIVHVAGMIPGGCFVGKLVDKHGRKWSLIGICYFLSIFNIMTKFTNNFLWFMFCRFMVGIFAGVSCAIMSYDLMSYDLEHIITILI